MKKSILSFLTILVAHSAFAATTGLQTPVIAGYIDATATGSAEKVVMNQAKQDGYNTVIVAFAYVNADGSVSFDQNTQPVAQKIIQEAKAANMQVLITFGGENNTFNPGNIPAETLAENMYNFAQKYKIDGLDFDLEIKTDPQYLDTLLSDIKTYAKSHGSFIPALTAAPQFNEGQLVTTGMNADYQQAISHGDFDALFIQEYNTNQQEAPHETDPDFISGRYNSIKGQVPPQTKIVIGEPAAAVGAGAATIYHPTPTQSLTTQQATALMLPRLKIIRSDTQFGGVMSWSLNVDYDAADFGDANHIPGTFAYGLKDCVMNGQCSTPPTPKPPVPNNTLTITNNGPNSIVVDVQDSQDGIDFKSYWLGIGSTAYSKTSTPSIASIEGKKGLTATWSTYKGGPSGTCQSFDLTTNKTLTINTTTKTCTTS
jgi:chitinase